MDSHDLHGPKRGESPSCRLAVGIIGFFVAMTTPMRATAVVQLTSSTDPSIPGGRLGSSWISPTSNRVVFKWTDAGTGRVDLFSRPTDASAPAVRLTDDASTKYFGPDAVAISPDGLYVAYEAGGVNQVGFELYGRSIDASGSVLKLTDTGGYDAVAPGFIFRPGAGHDLIRRREGDTTGSDVLQLFSADGSQSPVSLTPTPAANEMQVLSFTTSANGSHAVFAIDKGSENWQLYANDLNAANGPVLLNTPAPFTYRLDYQVTADGQRVVYFQERNASIGQLYACQTSGAGTPVPIGAPFRWSPGRQAIRLSPDGQSVVFSSNAENPDFDYLYAAPTDGSAVPVRLTNWDVANYEFTHDGLRVVYSADTDNYRTVERVDSLFSQPANGGPAIQLYKAADSTGDISSLTLADNRVLFLSSFAQSLWMVPADASGAAVRVLGLSSGQSITDLSISPDGRYAIFGTNLNADPGAEALYALSVRDGTLTRLNQDFVGSTDILWPKISDNGRWVTFTAKDATTDGLQLFAVALPEPSVIAVSCFALTGLTVRRRRAN